MDEPEVGGVRGDEGLPELSAHVDEGKTASSIFVAAIAVAIGLLNSAAMTA